MVYSFQKGDKVEVLKRALQNDEASVEPIWFSGTVLRSRAAACRKTQIYVEFETLLAAEGDGTECADDQLVPKPRMRGYVEFADVRPAPPVELHRFFKVGEVVEVFCAVKKGWRKAEVFDILENSKYAVSFCCSRNGGRERIMEEVEQWNLRVLREWDDGSWVPPPFGPERGSSSGETRTKKLKVRIKCPGKTSDLKKVTLMEVAMSSAKQPKVRVTSHVETSKQIFSKGMMVEVKSNEQGYLGSWYTAQIVGRMGDSKYLVEYQTLRTEDESELLIETAESSFIRPCPPQIKKVEGYKMLEEVNAWYNDGWWVGLISRILGAWGYAVYFWTTNEELEFNHCDLRLHQEWIGGKWTTAFRQKSELPMNTKLGRVSGLKGAYVLAVRFLNESRVEVTSDEEGYKDCWYPAKVLKPVKYRKYLVEYATLTTDDQMELLKQEVDALCIRPSPLLLFESELFKSLEVVDAWYNEGWWVGLICEVTRDSKYMVYLKTMKEVIEFQHSDLRPHQDWHNQQWVCPLRGRH